MGQARFIVCRAGASTLAELDAVGRAALLVPYPFGQQPPGVRRPVSGDGRGRGNNLNKDFTGDLSLVSKAIPHRTRTFGPDGSRRPPTGEAGGGEGDCGGVYGVDPTRLILGSLRGAGIARRHLLLLYGGDPSPGLGSGHSRCMANLTPPSPQPPPIKGGGVEAEVVVKINIVCVWQVGPFSIVQYNRLARSDR